MRLALMSVAVNVAVAISLYQVIGVPGVAVATSLASWCNVVGMAIILWRRGLYHPSAQAWSRLARILAASAAMGQVRSQQLEDGTAARRSPSF